MCADKEDKMRFILTRRKRSQSTSPGQTRRCSRITRVILISIKQNQWGRQETWSQGRQKAPKNTQQECEAEVHEGASKIRKRENKPRLQSASIERGRERPITLLGEAHHLPFNVDFARHTVLEIRGFQGNQPPARCCGFGSSAKAGAGAPARLIKEGQEGERHAGTDKGR
ncbi:hypothetical protein AOLI_G00091070 [Acnodon oligacanthus]